MWGEGSVGSDHIQGLGMAPFLFSLSSLSAPGPFLAPRIVLFWDGGFSDPNHHSESYKPFLTRFFAKPRNPAIRLLSICFPNNDRNSIEAVENHFKPDFYCTMFIHLQKVERYLWKTFLKSLFFKSCKDMCQRNAEMLSINIYASKWSRRFSIKIISPSTQGNTVILKKKLARDPSASTWCWILGSLCDSC